MFGLIGFILGYTFRVILSIIFKATEIVVKTGFKILGFFVKKVQKGVLEMRTIEKEEYNTDSLTKYALNIDFENNIIKNITANKDIRKNKNNVMRRTQRV